MIKAIAHEDTRLRPVIQLVTIVGSQVGLTLTAKSAKESIIRRIFKQYFKRRFVIEK